MAKVYITQRQRDHENLKRSVRVMLAKSGIKQGELARKIGVSPQLLSYRLGHDALLATDLVAIIRHLSPDLGDIKELLGLKEGQ